MTEMSLASRTETMTETDRVLMQRFEGEGAVVINKTDLTRKLTEEEVRNALPGIPCMTVSAKDPESLKPLTAWIEQFARVSDQLALTQPRHLDAARRAVSHMKDAMNTLEYFTADVAATDLQAAQAALSEITGDRADEKLLDRVFAQFCVGK